MRTFPATSAASASRRPAAEDADGEAGFRTYGKSKDSRDDLPAGRRRDGRHPGRDPGPGLVLAREHRRLRPDPPGQGRHAATGRCRRSSGSPTAASPPQENRRALHAGRRRVHHRGEAPLRLRRGEGRPVPAGTLQGRPGQPPGQGSPHRRRRTTGSSSATTPTRPNATPPSAPASSRSSKELIDGTDKLARRRARPGSRASSPAGPA